ncbi:General negative regulator of transcription subunit 2 [Ceratocystis fimbriata CBS 114723]|uniref:General negative regulator of transcription subunit 2 n=1 Tax=Ceratocystis fimbriata CBS 114723 TaxID=1035309 RepID=A0A2C5WZJ3_9PEZI|nr:General negative regulator of transcription subunit 2 [Ceratocystis fimbriata CBS 114723]
MNRSGSVPQQMRMPVGYGQQSQAQSQSQQQPQSQQPGRAGPNRLPNGNKMANSGWAFGGSVPMGAPGMQPTSRPLGLGAGNVSFAQSLGATQAANPLDPSDFPSLSNNSQMQNTGHASLWATSAANGPRSVGPIPRAPSTTLASHIAQQEDPFSPGATSGRLNSAQGSFRFGSQGNMNVGQPSQPPQQMPSSSIDDFPPLNNRGGTTNDSTQIQNMGFQAVGGPSVTSSGQNAQSAQSRSGNGLLNALSANNNSNNSNGATNANVGNSNSNSNGSGSGNNNGMNNRIMASNGATTSSRHQEQRPSVSEDKEAPTSISDSRHPHGAIGNNDQSRKSSIADDNNGVVPPSEAQMEIHDPLGTMPEADKWGLKGLTTLMERYPDYNAMLSGIDVTQLGLDLASTEMISTQNYSLFDDMLPYPAISKFRLPECYNVTNVQSIEQVIRSFNEESLFWIFYSCPADVRQHMAAAELHSRNWRWHKKMCIWITKDEIMVPQAINANEERGFYIVWDTNYWRKERRELLLSYSDLETPNTPVPPQA